MTDDLYMSTRWRRCQRAFPAGRSGAGRGADAGLQARCVVQRCRGPVPRNRWQVIGKPCQLLQWTMTAQYRNVCR